MGMSGWTYRVPFDEDAGRAFTALQQRELADGHYHWKEEPTADELADILARFPEWEQFRVPAPPRPTSLEHLAQLKDDEEYDFWAWGTHSILDMDRVEPANAEADLDGGLRLLSAREVRKLLGGDHPSAEDFEAAYHRHGSGMGVAHSRWTGRYTVLYRDGEPHELAFWGFSGD